MKEEGGWSSELEACPISSPWVEVEENIKSCHANLEQLKSMRMCFDDEKTKLQELQASNQKELESLRELQEQIDDFKSFNAESKRMIDKIFAKLHQGLQVE